MSKHFLIVGGTSGIGAALLASLIERGHQVTLGLLPSQAVRPRRPGGIDRPSDSGAGVGRGR